jgi:hypothetical protein
LLDRHHGEREVELRIDFACTYAEPEAARHRVGGGAEPEAIGVGNSEAAEMCPHGETLVLVSFDEPQVIASMKKKQQ